MLQAQAQEEGPAGQEAPEVQEGRVEMGATADRAVPEAPEERRVEGWPPKILLE